MNYFEKCQHCKPPERYPGCQDHCPHYKEARAKFDADKAKANKDIQLKYYANHKHAETVDGIAKYFRRRPKNKRIK